tara:strand:+ start:288 stop:734 length:447 start_codon:yes stop_codon:yes gene_type:complete
MAVPTGSGTETLHSHLMENVDAAQTLIYGAQHHVYTVMSIIVYCEVLNATTDYGYLQTKGYGAHYSSGQTGMTMRFARFNIQVGETYVWNDKFSFNGYEPSGTAILSAAVQILIAAQGGSAVQELQFDMTSQHDDFNIVVTYLDQDWS